LSEEWVIAKKPIAAWQPDADLLPVVTKIVEDLGGIGYFDGLEALGLTIMGMVLSQGGDIQEIGETLDYFLKRMKRQAPNFVVTWRLAQTKAKDGGH
jgi:hypothetical protein